MSSQAAGAAHGEAPPRVRKLVTGPLPSPPADPASPARAQALPPLPPPREIVLPDAILTKLVRNAARALHVDRCALALVDAQAGDLVTVAAVPTPTPSLRRSRFRPGEGIAGTVALSAQPLCVPDVQADPRFKPLGTAPIRSLLCVPLLDTGRVLGTLTATAPTPHAFQPSDLDLLGIFADQAALAIAQAQRAEEVERLKRAVLSTVSHELRTPLHSIRGFVDLLLAGRPGPLTPLQRDFLASVQLSTKQLQRLVEDILQVSLAEAGALRLVLAPTAVGGLLRRVARQLQPQAEAGGVTLTLAVGAGLPRVMADEARLEQVLSNLVGNAVKFTPRGGQVRLGAEAGEGGVWLRVRDTGPGIAVEEQARIFERLYQVEHGLNRAYGGVGLGLTIAKQLVEAQGGRITVQSQPGQGATFSVWLPAAPSS